MRPRRWASAGNAGSLSTPRMLGYQSSEDHSYREFRPVTNNWNASCDAPSAARVLITPADFWSSGKADRAFTACDLATAFPEAIARNAAINAAFCSAGMRSFGFARAVVPAA